MDEYKRFARLYDPLLHVALHRIRKKVADAVQHYNPGSVIDICCGTGSQLKYLKKNGFHNVTGVDISKSMLRQAEKGEENVQCDEQDATSLKFDDNSFDMGIISFALHEKPSEVAKQIVMEAQRVIRPEGHLIVVDYIFGKRIKFPVKFAIHFVERFAGRDHYRYFRNYLKQGGMDNLMKEFTLKEDQRFHSGSTGMRIYSLEKYGHYA